VVNLDLNKTQRHSRFIQNNVALVLISVAIIIVERIVKLYVVGNLRLGEAVPVIGNLLVITRSENIGAGFGILKGYNFVFLFAAFVVLLLIIYFYNMIIHDRLLTLAFSFILGGTVGNMIDRIFYGYVIDYISLSFWPTFNISDAALTVGAVLLIVYMCMWEKNPKEEMKRFGS
jgi:signal peptidase II